MINLSGKKFGRLTVKSHKETRFSSLGKRVQYWRCICDCGNERTIQGNNLKSGAQVSCGCFKSENTSKRNTTHGLSSSPIYRVWSEMLQRCKTKTCKGYKNYGGRGICVCDRWLKFQNFHSDMWPSWKSGLTIERINNDGNYEPSNCRWATKLEQANNTRKNRKLTCNGITKTLAQWSRFIGGKHGLVDYRLKSGWSVKDAVTTPPTI